MFRFILISAAVLAASTLSQAADRTGNTSSGNVTSRTTSNTSTNTSTQTTTYAGGNRFGDEVCAGRIQGRQAQAWMFVHPCPK